MEAFGLPEGNGAMIGLRDRSGLSDVVLSLSAPALHILAMMDGENCLDEIRGMFFDRFGQPLSEQTIGAMLDHLEDAHLLEGPGFEAHYQSRLHAFRASGMREMPNAGGLGIDAAGAVFEDMLSSAAPPVAARTLRGVIAPHLDYPRGRPCYTAAYSALRGRAVPDRIIILGTNHFGRSAAVVATANDFHTPLGRTEVDRAFLEQLESRCGDLRAFELDHAREHSIELQVAWLQHLFGAEKFTILPVLCPDPCGPTGTAPRDGKGVDLREFATALAKLIAADAADTLFVTGADLSHVGAAFGDERELDESLLDAVRQRDRLALTALVENGAEAFLSAVAQEDNPTRVCSAGCIFALAHALSDASASLVGYHQAVDHPSQTCVSCAAVLYA